MKNFNRGGGFKERAGGNFARRESGGRDFKRGGNDSRPAMYKAVCAECGADCEVPFKPSGERPVLCSHCFKKDGSDSRGNNRHDSRPERVGSREFSFNNVVEKRMFKAVCDTCGQTCEVPFQPTAGKPVYCSDCFNKENNRKGTGASNNVVREQFEILNSKLDKILRALNQTMGDTSALNLGLKKEDKHSSVPENKISSASKKSSLKPLLEKVETKSTAAPKKSKKAGQKIVATKIKLAKRAKRK